MPYFKVNGAKIWVRAILFFKYALLSALPNNNASVIQSNPITAIISAASIQEIYPVTLVAPDRVDFAILGLTAIWGNGTASF